MTFCVEMMGWIHVRMDNESMDKAEGSEVNIQQLERAYNL